MVSLLLSPCTGVFEQPCKLIKHGGRRIHEDTRYFRTCQQGKDSLRGEIWMWTSMCCLWSRESQPYWGTHGLQWRICFPDGSSNVERLGVRVSPLKMLCLYMIIMPRICFCVWDLFTYFHLEIFWFIINKSLPLYTKNLNMNEGHFIAVNPIG